MGDKGGRCLGLTTLPPSCADCLEIWEPSGPIQASNEIALPFYHVVFNLHSAYKVQQKQ